MKQNIKNIKETDLVYGSMILIPLSTLLQGYISLINQGLIAVIFVAYFLNIIQSGIRKKGLYSLMYVFVCICIAFLGSEFAGHVTGLRRLIYFPFMIFTYYIIIGEHKKCIKFFKEHKKLVDGVLNIWTILVGISIFIPSCYSDTEGWGSFKYFYSFTVEGGARLGGMTLLIMTMILMQMVVWQNKKYIYYFIVPLYTIFMCGSRIYLVLGLIEFVVAFYLFLNNKKYFWYMVIPLGVILVSIAFSTALGSKLESVQYTENSIHNIYDTVSNGRFTPIIDGAKRFIEEPVVRKVFGNGYGFIEDEMHHWAFNDYIDIGLVFGVFGLLIYGYWVHQSTKLLKKSKLPWYMLFAQWCCWLVLAMFGMYYRITTAVIAIPFAYLACYAWKKEENK